MIFEKVHKDYADKIFVKLQNDYPNLLFNMSLTNDGRSSIRVDGDIVGNPQESDARWPILAALVAGGISYIWNNYFILFVIASCIVGVCVHHRRKE